VVWFSPSSFFSFKWHKLKYILYLDGICYDYVEPHISSYEIIIVELKDWSSQIFKQKGMVGDDLHFK
jgi:hypothetical protein